MHSVFLQNGLFVLCFCQEVLKWLRLIRGTLELSMNIQPQIDVFAVFGR